MNSFYGDLLFLHPKISGKVGRLYFFTSLKFTVNCKQNKYTCHENN